EQATKISYTGFASANTGTVFGASDAELRFLTVQSTGAGNGYAIAIFNTSASPSLLHVTAIASGGMSYGVYNTNGSAPTMKHVTASTSVGGGLYDYAVYNGGNSSPTMLDVAASASGGIGSYGVYNTSGSSPAMSDVTASASGAIVSNYAVYNTNS